MSKMKASLRRNPKRNASKIWNRPFRFFEAFQSHEAQYLSKNEALHKTKLFEKNDALAVILAKKKRCAFSQMFRKKMGSATLWNSLEYGLVYTMTRYFATNQDVYTLLLDSASTQAIQDCTILVRYLQYSFWWSILVSLLWSNYENVSEWSRSVQYNTCIRLFQSNLNSNSYA